MKVEHFYCYGCIGENDPFFTVFTGEQDPTISSLKVSDFLKSLASDVTDIVVHINSRGGSVDEGFAIHDLFVNSGKKIKTLIEGQCASIATVVLLAGTEREALPNASGLIHNPWIDPWNLSGLTADEIQALADSVKAQEEKLLNFYVEKTGADKALLSDYMKAETKFNPDQMLELKFITKINEPVKAFAYSKPKNHNQNNEHMNPKNKSFMEKLTAIKNAVNDIFKNETPEVVASTANTSDGVAMYFEGTLAEKTLVFSDAEMTTAFADGTYEMEDGSTVTIAAGAVTVVAAKAVVTPVAKTEAELKAENEALAKELAELKAAKIEVETSALTEMNAMKERLANIKSNYVPKTSTTQFPEKKTDADTKAETKEERKKAIAEAEAKAKA